MNLVTVSQTCITRQRNWTTCTLTLHVKYVTWTLKHCPMVIVLAQASDVTIMEASKGSPIDM